MAKNIATVKESILNLGNVNTPVIEIQINGDTSSCFDLAKANGDTLVNFKNELRKLQYLGYTILFK